MSLAAPTLERTINEDSADPGRSFGVFDSYPVELYDIDGDGKLEIILHNDNKRVYIFNSTNGRLMAELDTKFPSGWGARTINGVEVAPVRSGRAPSLWVYNSAAYLTRFDFNRSASDGEHMAFDKKWERRLNDYSPNAGADSKPVLADLNRDGVLDVVAQVEERGLFAIKGDGAVLWKKNLSGGNAEPVVNDWDRDGWLDTIFFSDDGEVRARRGKDGAYQWDYHAQDELGFPASIPRGGTVWNLTGTARREVVFAARDAHNRTVYSENHAGLFVVGDDNKDGTPELVWLRQPSWAPPLWYTRLVIYDHNGNGSPEIYGQFWNTIGHNPGNFEVVGKPWVFSYSRTGDLLWRTDPGTFWSNKDIFIADVDNDGKREVVANGPNAAGHDGLWLLHINNGTKDSHIDMSPYKLTRSGRLADLDRDGKLEIVVQIENDTGGDGPGIQIWNTDGPASSLTWSGAEDKTDTPAPFVITFVPDADSSRYWVEVHFKAFHKIAAGWYREADGPGEPWGEWQPLDAAGGDQWQHSADIEPGHVVSFRAKDEFGEFKVSGTFDWPP